MQLLLLLVLAWPGLGVAATITAGVSHTVEIRNGKLYAWGYNAQGQLGDGSTTQRLGPVQVGLPAGVLPTAVAAGDAHSLAIGTDGMLYAWGDNRNGQLGDGSTTQRTSPVQVGLPAGVTPTAVAASSYHSLAIGSDGKLYAWGRNGGGQLGNGTTTDRLSPVQVGLPAGVTPTAVAAGASHSLAIGSDGKLYAWGYNVYGQLGDGTTTDRLSPVQVSLPAGVSPTAVAACQFHSLAIGSDGKLYAWGYNAQGQLGDSSTTSRTTPVQVDLPAGLAPTAVAAGSYHGLAIGSDGKFYAWGLNSRGQLGDGSTTVRLSPVQVGLPAGVTPTAVAAGDQHSLATGSDGKLYAWGFNGNGQLGDGSTTQRTSPMQVGLPAATVAAGGTHSLEIRSGRLYAWGSNGSGQLGDGSTTQRTSPGLVNLPAGVTPTAVAAGEGLFSLASGSNGKLYAWGANNSGQLGDGSTTNRLSPVEVNLPGAVSTTAVAAGSSHSLAIGSDGKLYTWGGNNSGQLGDGSFTRRLTPAQVSLPAGVSPVAVAAGLNHSLTIGADGKLFSWGSNGNGQLGDGSNNPRASPGQVGLPAGVAPTAVAAGWYHSLAIGSDGKLYAWGLNNQGQLGDGTVATRTSPVLVVGLPAGVTPTAVAAGVSHSVAIGSDGKLYAWGLNSDGQLGDGSNTRRLTPVQVGMPAGVTPAAAAAGDSHSLALGSDGKLYAWGYNINGQLGNGSTAAANLPTPVVSYPAPPSQTTLTSSPNPSIAGQTVTLAATVTGTSPTGTVQFRDGATNLGAPVTLVNGQASYVASSLASGGHTLTAAYSGDAGNAASTSAAVVQVVRTAATIAAGGSHSLEIRSGRLYAWGGNFTGQLGDGSTTSRASPVLTNLPPGVTPTAVAAGGNHSLAVGSDGKLYAWGQNYVGQLGDGSATDRLSPVQVNLPTGVTPISVAAGNLHSLAIGSDGKLYAWGENDVGQLGDGTRTQSRSPVQVGLPAGVTPTVVAAGGNHSLAIGSDGKLYAWGYNDSGQIGDGSLDTERLSPVPVNLPAGVTPVGVAGGGWHSLAIGSDGKLYAWGRNVQGQLGDGGSTQRLSPVQVALPAGVTPTASAAGFLYSLAIGSDGKLYAWGDNGSGQLGDGSFTSRRSPVPVNLPAGAVPSVVSAGSEHSLATGSDGKLYAWGSNGSGRLGSGTVGAPSNLPVPVAGYPAPPSQTTLTASPNPSIAGQAVTLAATVTGTSPTGTVQFRNGATHLGAPVSLVNGQASYVTNTLGAGSNSLTALYSGDGTNSSSTSPAVTQTVNKAMSNTALAVDPTAAVSGQTVTLTAAVTVTVGLPGGRVAFFDAETYLGDAGFVSGSPNGPAYVGIAVFTTNTLSAGNYSLTARYLGDNNNLASASIPVMVTVASAPVGGGGDGDIPTLPEWGAILLGLTLLTMGMRQHRRTGLRELR